MNPSTRACPRHRLAWCWTLLATAPGWAQQDLPTSQTPDIVITDRAPVFRQFNKVEITGSAILAKEAKEALPLQVIGRREIERSGATSLSELVQQLPLMLNFQEQGTMTGTASGGPETAAIHGNQSGTLVLLNGRRLPYYGSQTIAGERAIVDLNILPLAAIDRIEMLTDGASSRYGSDAVAGVVNIITNNSAPGVQVSAMHIAPRGGVASGRQMSLSWGQGRTERDGYSLQAHFTAQHQRALYAGDRSASRDPIHRISVNGVDHWDTVDSNQLFSLYGAPAYNMLIRGQLRNTYYDQYGQCPNGSFLYSPTGQANCYVNKQALYTVYPETQKQQVYLKAEKHLAADWIVFSELVMSQNTQKSVPDGYNEFDSQLADGSVALMAAAPLDVLRQKYQNDMHNAMVGLRGDWAGWNITGSLSFGQHKVNQRYFSGLARSSILNGLSLTLEEIQQQPKQYSADTLAKFETARYVDYGVYADGGQSRLMAINALASKEIYDTHNGPVSLGLGLSAQQESTVFTTAPNPFTRRPSFDGKRNNIAFFSELQAPLSETIETTLSARQDQYSDFGSVTTGKAGLKWKAQDHLFFRSSIGTGFRAPTLAQMVEKSTYFRDRQINGEWIPIYYQGNPRLQPEKSTQTNFGFRFEPSRQWSMGLDWWQLRISDTFGNIDPNLIVNTPELRSQYLVTDNGSQVILSPNSNLGRSRSSGIDYDIQWRQPTEWGLLRWSLRGMHILQSERQYAKDSPYVSDLAQFSRQSNSVTARNQWVLRTSLEQSQWSAHVAVNFRSGNTEATRLASADSNITIPFTHSVPSYWTLDIGGRWNATEKLTLSFALNNALDSTPPLRLLTENLLQGIDTRYANYYGRTLRLKAEYKF